MHLSFTRQLAVSLALAAMLLRALLPDGWMPNTGSAAAASPFLICSIDGAHQRDGKTPADQERHHGPCAFAAAGHLSPPSDVSLALGTTTDAVRIASRYSDDFNARAPPWRPNAAPPPHDNTGDVRAAALRRGN